MTAPIRCRSRRAVSCFPSFQIGISTESTSALVTALIGFPPIAGDPSRRNDERQTSAVSGLRQVPARILITISAALSKVGVVDRSRGSRPWKTARAFSSAASRASARVTIGNGPSPMLQGLPLMRSLWLQDFAKPPCARGFTSRLKPCPPWPSP